MSRVSELTETLRGLAAEGYTANEAAEATGASKSGVSMAAMRNGFRFVKEAERTVARVRACAEEGLTASEAARRLGMDRVTPGRIAKANGFRFVNGNDLRALNARQKEAEERVARLEAARLAWPQSRIEAERHAREEVERAQRDPVRIVLAFIEERGRISEAAAMRVDEAVLGAVMARVAPARGSARP